MNGKNLGSRVKRLEEDTPRTYCLCLDPKPGQTDDEAIEEFYAAHPEARNDKSGLPFLFP
jgi:hypothetical protein